VGATARPEGGKRLGDEKTARKESRERTISPKRSRRGRGAKKLRGGECGSRKTGDGRKLFKGVGLKGEIKNDFVNVGGVHKIKTMKPEVRDSRGPPENSRKEERWSGREGRRKGKYEITHLWRRRSFTKKSESSGGKRKNCERRK